MTTLRKPLPQNTRVVVDDITPDQQPSTLLVRQDSITETPKPRPKALKEADQSQHEYCDGVLDSYYLDDCGLDRLKLDPAPLERLDSDKVPALTTLADVDHTTKTSKHEATLTIDSSPAVLAREGEAVGQSEASSPSKTRTKFTTAAQDTSFFLGGLIKHPAETVKHYSILRHSHGLVYYKGPETSLALSIFSDAPLLGDRQLWLQVKGWTGNTGMKVKALLGVNDSWINVTPDKQVDATELPLLDERAWQRDIKKFIAKANRTQKTHTLRETVVVRMPYEANDGYFRIVLTAADSKHVLCPSPVFRVASTSMSASTLRGASLKTLPIELGLKFAQKTATTMTFGAVASVVTTVKDQVASAAPLMQYASHAETAWNTIGAQDRIDDANDQYYARQTATIEGDLSATIQSSVKRIGIMIGSEAGPVSPFPISLDGLVVKGTGSTTSRFGMPTCNLDDIAPDLLAPLPTGVYLGWALVQVKDKEYASLHEAWRHVVITIVYASTSTAKVAQRKVVRTHIVYKYPEDISLIGSRLQLVLMGYLRPLVSVSEPELMLLEMTSDIAITHASLSRPAWGHEETMIRIKTQQSGKSVTDRLVDFKVAGQRQIDRVPVHRLGMRMDSYGMRDRGMHGNGGFWTKRD